ncbi:MULTISPECIES: AAA family ATPase [Stenotrophomonas maltophilia group]|uniref:AAA family ATPase n=1 Tax=Stenotrophomonas pavanii TaxID=487698 RepID=A0ABM7R6H6_9GAMM|nr:AAA family ATPase [Stenotrophomonas pavanii]BCX45068.1 AAA family ATPase [Stenotrophomonas pavanii]
MHEVTPHNAFTPAKEVQDIERFAGRTELLDGLSGALQADGAQIVLYGQRGIGKSSLARVLGQMATNAPEAISRLSVAPHVKFDYFPVHITCDDSIDCIDKLLLRLLTDSGALADWIPFKVIEHKTTAEGGGKVGIKVVELSGKKTGAITERAVEVEADLQTTFINACRSIVNSGVSAHGLLIIIDEFDRISNKKGIASLLKAIGPEKVTFAMVGVASDINELIADHESVTRQLADGNIRVTPMDRDDLAEIISRAMTALDDKYAFELAAIQWITSVAKGHPFYVHLIGKHALLKTIQAGQEVVTEAIAREALADIAMKESAPVQEATYKRAVGHSYVRERILKGFAGRDEQEIYTTELYSEMARELGVDPSAISVYVGHLASEKYGAVISKARDRYYQFNDSLFKAYAAARPYERKPGDHEPDAG